MTLEENKALVRRFLDEVYNKGNLTIADELVADKYTSHNQLEIEVLGPEGIKKAAIQQRTAFPDLITTVEDIVAEGDRVVVRGVDRGTHQGTFGGFAPMGKAFVITWIDIFRIENGKLAEAWLEINIESFKRQLSPDT